MGDVQSRRKFLKRAAGASVAVAGSLFLADEYQERRLEHLRRQPVSTDLPEGERLVSNTVGYAAPPMDPVRLGFIGVGARGTLLVQLFLKLEGVAVKAICDIRAPHAEKSRAAVLEAGKPAPELYTRGDTDYRRMCEREDLDAVIIATPWEWHVPMAVDAMNAGKHAFVEVPAAVTLDECRQLVETAEQTRRHCMMLENCCYGQTELMVLNMARRGLFGELLHAEGAYIHDMREGLFSDTGKGLWRRQHSVERNGNLYPTHGLGPVAQALGINRGDRMERLVSMSSPSLGLPLYAKRAFGEKDPRAQVATKNGDINTSLIRTARGRTIMVQHNTHSPRPYDRIHLVQGTRGVARGFPDRIFIEGQTEGRHWESMERYREEFEHPLWRKIGDSARLHGGHGGMDFVMCWRLIHCLRHGLPLDMSVYDAAAWSAVSELSERSMAKGGEPMEFPDFTRGAWKKAAPLDIRLVVPSNA